MEYRGGGFNPNSFYGYTGSTSSKHSPTTSPYNSVDREENVDLTLPPNSSFKWGDKLDIPDDIKKQLSSQGVDLNNLSSYDTDEIIKANERDKLKKQNKECSIV